MEATEGMNVFVIITGEDLNKTMIVANDKKEAIRKFFNMFSNLRDVVISGEVGKAIEISWDQETEKESTLPYLVILGAVSKEEAINSLHETVNSKKKCEEVLHKGMQECQWIRETRY